MIVDSGARYIASQVVSNSEAVTVVTFDNDGNVASVTESDPKPMTIIEYLWQYAQTREQPFRDLLALVEVADRKRADLDWRQETALMSALNRLFAPTVTPEMVDYFIRDFIKCGLDITDPIRQRQK